jgi:hypothetical protein
MKKIISADNDRLITQKDHFADIDHLITEKDHFADINLLFTEIDDSSFYIYTRHAE